MVWNEFQLPILPHALISWSDKVRLESGLIYLFVVFLIVEFCLNHQRGHPNAETGTLKRRNSLTITISLMTNPLQAATPLWNQDVCLSWFHFVHRCTFCICIPTGLRSPLRCPATYLSPPFSWLCAELQLFIALYILKMDGLLKMDGKTSRFNKTPFPKSRLWQISPRSIFKKKCSRKKTMWNL